MLGLLFGPAAKHSFQNHETTKQTGHMVLLGHGSAVPCFSTHKSSINLVWALGEKGPCPHPQPHSDVVWQLLVVQWLHQPSWQCCMATNSSSGVRTVQNKGFYMMLFLVRKKHSDFRQIVELSQDKPNTIGDSVHRNRFALCAGVAQHRTTDFLSSSWTWMESFVNIY